MRRRVLPVLITLCSLLNYQSAFAQGQTWYGSVSQQQIAEAPHGYQSGSTGSMPGQQFNQQSFQQPYQQQMQGQMPNQFMSVQMSQNAGFVPNNAQSQSLPMLNSAMAPQANPYASGIGASAGVDILDESLKYHNQGNMQQQQPQNFNQNTQNNMNARANSMSAPLFNHSGNQNGTNCSGAANQGCGHGNSAGGSSSGGGISTQAIGAIGAAALVGTFLTNGGIGGMMKNVGWDNKRHVRGMSIGGY